MSTPVFERQKSPELTPRQLEVLAMIGQGLSNKLIAARLEIAESTIKMHITAIFKALGVSNRTQAAIIAKQTGALAS
jgi:DNA-binding NarL/FixJ family response regulator